MTECSQQLALIQMGINGALIGQHATSLGMASALLGGTVALIAQQLLISAHWTMADQEMGVSHPI